MIKVHHLVIKIERCDSLKHNVEQSRLEENIKREFSLTEQQLQECSISYNPSCLVNSRAAVTLNAEPLMSKVNNSLDKILSFRLLPMLIKLYPDSYISVNFIVEATCSS